MQVIYAYLSNEFKIIQGQIYLILKKCSKTLTHMVSVTCVLSQFSSPLKNPPATYPFPRDSVIPSLTFISKMKCLLNTMLNFIPEATSIIKQVLTIYLNTIFLTSNLVIRIEKIFWQSKLLDLEQLTSSVAVKKINIFKSIFSIKVSFEGDFLSCLRQLFEIEESEIYGDYLQLRELVEIDKKFVDRSGPVIDEKGKI